MTEMQRVLFEAQGAPGASILCARALAGSMFPSGLALREGRSLFALAVGLDGCRGFPPSPDELAQPRALRGSPDDWAGAHCISDLPSSHFRVQELGCSST